MTDTGTPKGGKGWRGFFTGDGPPAGLRRPNRLPIAIAAGAVLLLGSGVVYTLWNRLETDKAAGDGETQKPRPAEGITFGANAPVSGEIGARTKEAATPPGDGSGGAGKPDQAIGEPTDGGTKAGTGQPAEEDPAMAWRRQAWTQYYQQTLALDQRRHDVLVQALAAPISGEDGQAGRQQAGAADPAASLSAEMATAMAGADAARAQAAMLAAGPGGGGDPNGQQAKRRFLSQPAAAGSNLLAGTRVPALSPFEIMAGTVIPSTMIGGINSDLPGQIKAQVAENVYDTATGNYLLIPQGSMLVGSYDNGVTMGQRRVLVAWTRIIFPDASSLDLGSMPGADQGGYAGFEDQVNGHFWRIFSNALLLSLFSAGTQLAIPQNQNSDKTSASDIIAAQLGQQMGELGMEYARRGLDIAPTLEIRNGYRFNIMVTKDVVFAEPWPQPETAAR